MCIQTLNIQNMNSYLKHKNSPSTQKEQRSPPETQSRHQRQKHKCPSCHEMSYLMCYGCCFEFTCQNCFTSQHYAHCKKKFNHHVINLSELGLEEQTKTKRNNKKWKTQEKCQRCLENCQKHEYCVRCKVSLCAKCLIETHSTGKFSHHTRIKSGSSPTKHKKMDTFVTQSDLIEDNAMKKSTKQNIETSETSNKVKERASKVYSTPSQKKGKSMVKSTNPNQQNITMTASRKPKNQQTPHQSLQQPQQQTQLHSPALNSWHTCHQHHKFRTILTQNCELICQECYQQIKSTVSKLRNVDIENWLSNPDSSAIKLSVQSSLNEFTLKMKELETEFSKHRQSLVQEFTKKQEILAQRYKSNIMNLEKWQNIYKGNITNILKACEGSIRLNDIMISCQKNETSSKEKIAKDISNIISFKRLISLQEISQYKKQYYNQEQQYQFKVNEMSTECFEELIKSFSFVRKKESDHQINSVNQQKSLSKFNQSAHLRQSRLSNSSLRTDRKTILRDDSFQRSNYYELSNSNNLLKRSMSKEVKDQLGKDISQKILFQSNSELKSEKKTIYGNNCKKLEAKPMKNSQYFFDNAQESGQKIKVKSNKEPLQLTNYCFKQVKYVDLQNFLTEKLDKIYDQRKEAFQSSKIAKATHIKQNLLKSDLQISTELIDLRQQQTKNNPISDSRMTYSINIENTTESMASRVTSEVSSINNSIHNNKNKRKSDYMEMRDRLRKPNVIHKIGK